MSRYFMIVKDPVRLAVPKPSRSRESYPGTRPARRREAGAGYGAVPEKRMRRLLRAGLSGRRARGTKELFSGAR